MRCHPGARLLWGLILLAGCAGPSRGAPPPQRDAHVREVEEWRRGRIERLRSESGWLTLVGLHWLEPGENSFGSDPGNRVVLPAPAPPFAGVFVLEPGGVRLRPVPGAAVSVDGRPATAEAPLRADDGESPSVVSLGSLALHVIKRGERYAIRAKDPNSPVRTGFRGIESFPVSSAWRVDAEFVPYPSPRPVAIPTVMGTTETMQAPGVVRFAVGGKTLTLEPVVESPGDDQWFFIFKDETSGHETYGAGRFLYTDVAKDGRVVVDFNKAYNPPCAFTPYATCPLPPPQNRLAIRVEAGEKAFGDH
jgi:uncharacterized protein (DUF1684 family)